MAIVIMEITTLYNTQVRLEEGDIIALDKKTNRLWIRVNNRLYHSCKEVNDLKQSSTLEVSSAGCYLRDKDLLPKELEWIHYSPNN